MNIITSCKQGSDVWFNLKLGRVSGTGFKPVMTKGKAGAKSKTRDSYMIDVAIERLTGQRPVFFENDAMKHGTETEPQARAMYELVSGNEVVEVAFIERDNDVGVSPDGLVGSDGMLEIKCPNTKTQVERYLGGIALPTTYKWQVYGQMWVAEREWCDFLSFDPRIESAAGYICNRIHRNEKIINELAEGVNVFVNDLHEMVNKLSKPLEY